MAQTLEQSFLESFHSVALGCSHVRESLTEKLKPCGFLTFSYLVNLFLHKLLTGAPGGRGLRHCSTIQCAPRLKHTDAQGPKKSVCVCTGSSCSATSAQNFSSSILQLIRFRNTQRKEKTNALGTWWKYRRKRWKHVDHM